MNFLLMKREKNKTFEMEFAFSKIVFFETEK